MTEFDQHPEALSEDQHLRLALQKLEQRIDEVGTWDVKGFEGHEAAALQTQLVRTYDELVTARKQVYFGRLDLVPAGKSAPETHYIGRIGFDQRGKIVVVDWRAPLARLFSRRRPGRAQYDSPDGRLTVDLQLKRQFNCSKKPCAKSSTNITRAPAPWRPAPAAPGWWTRTPTCARFSLGGAMPSCRTSSPPSRSSRTS